MSKEQLQARVLDDPRIEVYDCGRKDIEGGQIDRRVLATLEFLANSGLKPTVTPPKCGHSYLTTSGNVSQHSSGDAVDIGAINGIPILGHQGKGSITDITIQRLLTLQGSMKPHQIISLMTPAAFGGADNILSLPDHDNHIHVGFHPMYNRSDGQAALKAGQWIKLIDRLNNHRQPDRAGQAVQGRDPGKTWRQRRRLTATSASHSSSSRGCWARPTGATSCARPAPRTPSTCSSCARSVPPRDGG